VRRVFQKSPARTSGPVRCVFHKERPVSDPVHRLCKMTPRTSDPVHRLFPRRPSQAFFPLVKVSVLFSLALPLARANFRGLFSSSIACPLSLAPVRRCTYRGEYFVALLVCVCVATADVRTEGEKVNRTYRLG